MSEPIVLRDIPVELTDRAVLDKLHLDAESGEEALELAAASRLVMRPKAILRAGTPETSDDGEMVLLGGQTFRSRILHTNLQGAKLAVGYVITCGAELGALSDSKADPLERYWQDEINECVLALAIGYAHAWAEEHFGLKPMYAMSPGSLPDWPIGQQRPLWAFLGDVPGSIGAHLKESCLMMPIKTVSGIYFTSETHYVNCELCPRESCPNRRAPYREEAYGRFGMVHG